MRRTQQARGDGATPSASDGGPAAERDDNPDSCRAPHADQAALVIEGEAYAQAYLDRLRTGMSQPGDLAAIVEFLRGEMLHGFCRLLQKSLEGLRHA